MWNWLDVKDLQYQISAITALATATSAVLDENKRKLGQLAIQRQISTEYILELAMSQYRSQKLIYAKQKTMLEWGWLTENIPPPVRHLIQSTICRV